MVNSTTNRYETMRNGGAASRADNPLSRLATRQRELEAELAAARRANLHARAKPDARQWHIQPAKIQEDEGWFTTYLDVMTLLLVLLVVMLSFAGKNAADANTPASATNTPAKIALIIPPAADLPVANISPIPASIGLLPAGNGLLPEIGIQHEHQARDDHKPPENEVVHENEPPLPDTVSPNSTAALATNGEPPEAVGTPEPDLRQTAPEPPVQDMLAGLPLGELGDDIDVIVNERSVSFRINSEILFGSGQADLSVPGLAVLKRLVPVFNSVKHKITVEGHTDSVPMLSNRRYPSNWELSGARAGSVVRYLEANGVASNRLRAVGNADTKPLGDNATPEGRASNRRVELIMEREQP